jgi:hypothetical protein
MNIEVLGLIGFALVAASFARTTYEFRRNRKSTDKALDRFRSLEDSRHYQIASTVSC